MQVKARDTLNEFVDYSLVSGDFDDAADVLQKHGQSQEARLVKSAQLGGCYPAEKV
jgi:hypothetical protein